MIVYSCLWLTMLLVGADAQCENGWNYFKDTHSCFLMSNKNLNFFNADLYCHSVGGHLASLTSREETNFVKGLSASQNVERVVGLSAPASQKCDFRWLDGTKMNTSAINFRPGALNRCSALCASIVPINGGNQDIALLNTVSCHAPTGGLMCKKPATPSRVSVKIPCDDGWTYYEETQSCFKHYVREGIFDHMVSHCNSFGANLASITTVGETEFVKDLVDKAKTFDFIDATFVGLTSPMMNCEYQWLDGTPLDETVITWKWAEGQPKYCKKAYCAALAIPNYRKNGPRGLLVENGCNEERYDNVLCKKRAVIKPEPTNPYCEPGWKYCEDTHSCFQYFAKNLNFFNADLYCHSKDAHLASLTTREETNFVTGMIANQRVEPIVGLSAPASQKCDFKWLDGTRMNTSAINFETGALDKCSPFCAKLVPTRAWSQDIKLLKTVSCHTPTGGLLCKKPAMPNRIPVKIPCDDGWTFYEETKSCFKQYTREGIFDQMVSHCHSFGANLASITTIGEANFVKALVDKGTTNDFVDTTFVGLTSPMMNCEYQWLDGTPLNESVVTWSWAEGKPQYCKKAYCAALAIPRDRKNGPRGLLVENGCNAEKYDKVLCKKRAVFQPVEETVECKNGWSLLSGTNTCIKDGVIPKEKRDPGLSLNTKCDTLPERTYFDQSTSTCYVKSADCDSVVYPGELLEPTSDERIQKILEKRKMKDSASKICAFGQKTVCRSGETGHDGVCFSLTDEAGSWSAASNACQKKDGSLFVPHNDRQMQKALNFLESNKPSSSSVWIGLVLTDEWKTVDGSEVDYLRWVPGLTNSMVNAVFLYDSVSQTDGSFAAYMRTETNEQRLFGLCSRVSGGF